MHVTLPVSAGLLHNVDTYMDALDAYHQGNIEPIVACLFDALELSVVLGAKICANVDEVLEKMGRAYNRQERIGVAPISNVAGRAASC